MDKLNSEVFSAMQTGKPLVSYRKTILGKVYVTVLNPFSGAPEGRLLHGNDEESVVDIWSEKEKAFFERMNKAHLKSGNLILYRAPEVKEKSQEEIYNSLTDDELREIANSKFLKLKSVLNKMTNVAPVFRLLNIAGEEEKSEKIIGAIKARLSELEIKEE